jgi:hypothetical protein
MRIERWHEILAQMRRIGDAPTHVLEPRAHAKVEGFGAIAGDRRNTADTGIAADLRGAGEKIIRRIRC